ncbi:hypothetical protein RDWZM_004708 [Blomia tropicalis]|uniref:Condensin complex subunit 2 n=1 Tax=Blomia tropicalis TaxID=40697 RepID=A0A9Q0M403_BLOTA|nr:hypothetical protein RDWZM_004708 [Blomia tropicalis]
MAKQNPIIDALITDMETNSFCSSPMNESRRKIRISKPLPQRSSLTSFPLSDKDDENESEIPPAKPTKNEFNHYLQSIHQINSKAFDPRQAFSTNFINNLKKFLVDPHGNTDFKLIGASLDAAVKVYSSKVDTVFRQAQKFSSSLVMATDQQVEIDDLDEGLLEDDDNNQQKKKKKKVNKRNNIIASADQLNGKFDKNIEIDPLFHQLSEAFDVGNVSSLLMVNLKTDPNKVMLLDSKASLDFENYKSVKPCPLVIEDINEINEFKEVFDSMETCSVCPKFGNFEFTNRESQLDIITSNPINLDSINYQIDIDGDVEEIDIHENDNIDTLFNEDFHADDDEESSILRPVDDHKLEDGRETSEDNTNKVLALLPHDDNHLFNKVFLRKFLKKRLFSNRIQPDHTKQKRLVKSYPENVFSLFEDEFELESSRIHEEILRKWYSKSKGEFLLTDHGFTSYGLRECGHMLGTSFLDLYKQTSGPHSDDINFTDTWNKQSSDEHQDDGVMNEDSFDINQDEFGFDSAPLSDNHIDDEHVEALDIDYAKVSKKVDIKRIKKGMWEIIEQESTVTVPMFGDSQSSPLTAEPLSQSKTISFSELRKNLPNKLGPNQSEGVNVAASFVALLHLCNEKGMELSAEDMSDFKIYSNIQ